MLSQMKTPNLKISTQAWTQRANQSAVKIISTFSHTFIDNINPNLKGS